MIEVCTSKRHRLLVGTVPFIASCLEALHLSVGAVHSVMGGEVPLDAYFARDVDVDVVEADGGLLQGLVLQP